MLTTQIQRLKKKREKEALPEEITENQSGRKNLERISGKHIVRKSDKLTKSILKASELMIKTFTH